MKEKKGKEQSFGPCPYSIPGHCEIIFEVKTPTPGKIERIYSRESDEAKIIGYTPDTKES